MKSRTLKAIQKFWLLLAIMTFPIFALQSQSSAASQVLTLKVNELNSVSIPTHTILLNNRRSAASDQIAHAMTMFIWTSNADSRKIVVSSPDVSQTTRLRISMEGSFATRWVAKPEIELMDPVPVDLIRSAEKSAGSCTVEFRVVTPSVSDHRAGMIAVFYTITSS